MMNSLLIRASISRLTLLTAGFQIESLPKQCIGLLRKSTLNQPTTSTNFIQKHSIKTTTSNWLTKKYNIAVIGSGPAGFYTAQQLLKRSNVSIDIYEKFPVPFGLVRFGVAPDHPEVKNVINSFTKVALNERTRFIGNINIGNDVTLQELRDAYHAVVLCYGSSQDSLLNIPGENLGNVISARRFVGWYNGIPQDKDLDVSFDSDTAIIIGQGNVALDCARILLLSIDSLKATDITNHSISKLVKSKIRKVIIVGRRGPLQAAFKIKEFRELTKMPDCHVKLDWSNDDRVNLDLSEQLVNSLPRSRKRIVELYKKIYDSTDLTTPHTKECVLKFFSSPIEIVSNQDENNPKVKSVRFKHNIMDDYVSESGKIIESPDDNVEEIPAGIVIRSIGYRSTPIDDSLPFDHKHGIILNKHGRVVDNVGLYCSGWAAFGATGVIINTMNASFDVAKNILSDIDVGLLDSQSDKSGYKKVQPLIESRNSKIVNFVDWQQIDRYERDLGKKEGKPREKIVSVEEILDIKDRNHKS